MGDSLSIQLVIFLHPSLFFLASMAELQAKARDHIHFLNATNPQIWAVKNILTNFLKANLHSIEIFFDYWELLLWRHQLSFLNHVTFDKSCVCLLLRQLELLIRSAAIVEFTSFFMC